MTTPGNIPLAKLCTLVANLSALLIAKNSALLLTDYNRQSVIVNQKLFVDGEL